MEGTAIVAVTNLMPHLYPVVLVSAAGVNLSGWIFKLHTASLVSPCIAVTCGAAAQRCKMAEGRSDNKCGVCKKVVANNDEALFCDGNSDKWFYIACVNT